MSKAIFVGSFDPWHNGHTDRLKNALKIFEKVTVKEGKGYCKR